MVSIIVAYDIQRKKDRNSLVVYDRDIFVMMDKKGRIYIKL